MNIMCVRRHTGQAKCWLSTKRGSVVSNIVKVAFLPHYKYSQVVKQEHSWALMWHVEILHSLPSDSVTPRYNTWICRETTRFYLPDGKGSKKLRFGL